MYHKIYIVKPVFEKWSMGNCRYLQSPKLEHVSYRKIGSPNQLQGKLYKA